MRSPRWFRTRRYPNPLRHLYRHPHRPSLRKFNRQRGIREGMLHIIHLNVAQATLKVCEAAGGVQPDEQAVIHNGLFKLTGVKRI